MFALRLAGPADSDEIAALYVRTRLDAYAPFFPSEVLEAMSVQDEAAKWRSRTQGSAAETVLAVDGDGAIASFTHVGWDNAEQPGTGEVEFMYVATEHQGNGLGARLMAEAEARLSARGMQDAVLWVYELNAPARGFYERCGWSDDGGRRASESAPGQHLARYRKRFV